MRPRDPTAMLWAKLVGVFAGLIGLAFLVYRLTGRYVADEDQRFLIRVAFGIGVGCLLVGWWLATWVSRRNDAPIVADEGATHRAEIAALRKRAFQTLRRLGARWWISRPPHRWMMVVGPPSSGKTSLLVNGGRAARMLDAGGAPPREGDRGDVHWVLMGDHLVLDVGGGLLDGSETSNTRWAALLSEAAHHRSCAGIDHVVVCLSAAELRRSGQVALQAAQLAVRLDQVPASGEHLDVHLVVTHVDDVVGFSELFGMLDEDTLARPLGRQLIGALDASGARAAAARVLGELSAAAMDQLPDRLGANASHESVGRALLLPAELDRLAEPIGDVLAEWCKAGLRPGGLWLTGRVGAAGRASRIGDELDARLGLRRLDRGTEGGPDRPAFVKQLVGTRVPATSPRRARPRGYGRAAVVGALALILGVYVVSLEQRALRELKGAVDTLVGADMRTVVPALEALSERLDDDDAHLWPESEASRPWLTGWRVRAQTLALRDAWMASVVHLSAKKDFTRRTSDVALAVSKVAQQGTSTAAGELGALSEADTLASVCASWEDALAWSVGPRDVDWSDNTGLCAFDSLDDLALRYGEGASTAVPGQLGRLYAAWLNGVTTAPDAPVCGQLSDEFALFDKTQRDLVKAVANARPAIRPKPVALNISGQGWLDSMRANVEWRADGVTLAACEQIHTEHILGESSSTCAGDIDPERLRVSYAEFFHENWMRWWTSLAVMQVGYREEGSAPIETELSYLLQPGGDIELLLERQGVGTMKAPTTCADEEGNVDEACCACACLRQPWSMATAMHTEGNAASDVFTTLQASALAVAAEVKKADLGKATDVVKATSGGTGALVDMASTISRFSTIPPVDPGFAECDCDVGGSQDDKVRSRVQDISDQLLSRASTYIFNKYEDRINQRWREGALAAWRKHASKFPLDPDATSDLDVAELESLLGCGGELQTLVDEILPDVVEIDPAPGTAAHMVLLTPGVEDLQQRLADVCEVVGKLSSTTTIELKWDDYDDGDLPPGIAAFDYQIDGNLVRDIHDGVTPSFELSATSRLRLVGRYERQYTGRQEPFNFGSTSVWSAMRVVGRPALRAGKLARGGTTIVLGESSQESSSRPRLGKGGLTFRYKEPGGFGPATALRVLSSFSLPATLVRVTDTPSE